MLINRTQLLYEQTTAAKKIAGLFFKEPAESNRRKHEGIYHTEYIQQGDKTVQLILLDVRTFRNSLLLYDTTAKLPRKNYFYTPDYQPHTSKDSLLLGEAQWKWLEEELKKPADLRLICCPYPPRPSYLIKRLILFGSVD